MLEPKLFEQVEKAVQQAQGIAVIRSVSVLDDYLRTAIKTKMRKLPKRLEKEIFTGYGPLSSFSSRIDLGFALKLFDGDIHHDLHSLRRLRNKFAHSTEHLHLASEAAVAIMQSLRGWTKDSSSPKFFSDKVHACIEALKAPIELGRLVDALLAKPNPVGATREN
jgi:DNA-binding MltR family transcriptional regulator